MTNPAQELWFEMKEELQECLEDLSSSGAEDKDIYLLMIELLKNCKIQEREDYANGGEKTLLQG